MHQSTVESSAFPSSLLAPNAGSRTADPGSVSFLTDAQRHDEGADDLSSWPIHPSVYLDLMVPSCFKKVDLRVPLLLAPFFFGSKLLTGINLALEAMLFRYEDAIGGRLLAYEKLRVEDTDRVRVTPELRGKVVVPVRASFLAFAPEVDSTVFVHITRLSERGLSIGHVLKQASVRFEARHLLSPFMTLQNGQWLYGQDLNQCLMVGSVISCSVVHSHREDAQGFLMSIDVAPGPEMMVLGADGQAEVLTRAVPPPALESVSLEPSAKKAKKDKRKKK